MKKLLFLSLLLLCSCKIDNSAIFRNQKIDNLDYAYSGFLGHTEVSWKTYKKDSDKITIKDVKATKTFPWKDTVHISGDFEFSADPVVGVSAEDSAKKSDFSTFFFKN